MENTMRNARSIAGCAAVALLLAGCASANPARDDVVCTLGEPSPPGAATPTGPTAMNPPPGYPPIMNPTVPIQVGAVPSNMGYGGARTPPTSASAEARCAEQPGLVRRSR